MTYGDQTASGKIIADYVCVCAAISVKFWSEFCQTRDLSLSPPTSWPIVCVTCSTLIETLALEIDTVAKSVSTGVANFFLPPSTVYSPITICPRRRKLKK